jgi:hypothetical protein
MARNGILMPDGRVLVVGTPEWLTEGSRRMTLLLDAQMRLLPPGVLQSPHSAAAQESPGSANHFGFGAGPGAWAAAGSGGGSGVGGGKGPPGGGPGAGPSGAGGGAGALAATHAQSIKSFNVKRKLSNAATPTVASRKDLQSPAHTRTKGAALSPPPPPLQAAVAPLQRAFQGLSVQGGFGGGGLPTSGFGALPTIMATSYSSDGSGGTSEGHPSPGNVTTTTPGPLDHAMSFDLGLDLSDLGGGGGADPSGHGGGAGPGLMPSMSEVFLDLDYDEAVPMGHTPRQAAPRLHAESLAAASARPALPPAPPAAATGPPLPFLAPLALPPPASSPLGVFALPAEPSPATWDSMAGAVVPGGGWTSDGRVPLHDGPIPPGPGTEDEAATQAAKEAARRKARGSYTCSKCGQPKRGHVCGLGGGGDDDDGASDDEGLDLLLDGAGGLLENDPWAGSSAGDGFGGFEEDALFDDALAVALGDAALIAGGSTGSGSGSGDPGSALGSPASTGQAARAAAEKKKLRTAGGYRCSRCGLPKKGHVCAFGDD